MNLATFVVAAVLAVIVFNIVKGLMKKGGNTCGCDCAHCPSACHTPVNFSKEADNKQEEKE